MAEIKPFTGMERVKLSEVVPIDTPFTFNIFPSNICNFNCNYCAQSLGKDYLQKEYDFPMELMPFEILQTAVNQAKRFPRKFKLVSFMGHGEPLLNKDLPKMIAEVKNADITERTDIITNASLLTREYSMNLINAGLDVLRVSIQGIDSNGYKNICNADINYKDFYENLAYFYEHKGKCQVYLKTVDASLKEGEEERFYEMFSPIADRVYVDRVKPVYHGVDYSESESDLSTDRYGKSHDNRLVCPQPFYMLSLWTNGDVTPCDGLYKASPLGNVLTDELADMWQSQLHRDFCIAHLKKQKNVIESCKNCCAPDDVAAKEDVMDDEAEEILKSREFYVG